MIERIKLTEEELKRYNNGEILLKWRTSSDDPVVPQYIVLNGYKVEVDPELFYYMQNIITNYQERAEDSEVKIGYIRDILDRK